MELWALTGGSGFLGLHLSRRLLADGSEIGLRIDYAVQPRPDGLAQAFLIGREFVGGKPFLLLVGDHLYVSHGPKRCAQQLIA